MTEHDIGVRMEMYGCELAVKEACLPVGARVEESSTRLHYEANQ
jgi:hypothetical protein